MQRPPPQRLSERGHAATRAQPVRAPAVANAFRILDYLAAQPLGAGVSDIARALAIGKSTCFNVLETLLAQEAVLKDLRTAQWRLGPKLVKLGAAARRGYSYRGVLRHAVQPLVDSHGLTCLVGQVLADHQGIVVIDRVLPRTRHADVVSAPIGEVYGPTAPAMGRAVLAYLDDDEALLVAGRSLDLKSAASRRAFLGKLEEIRKAGYATSLAEYAPGTHALACVVPAHGAHPEWVLCLVGQRQQLPRSRMPALAAALMAVARSLPGEFITAMQ